MKKIILSLCGLFIVSLFCGYAQDSTPTDLPKVKVTESEKTLNTQWQGKRVAFLGDSMTDKRRVGTTCVYWEYLTELMGIEPFVYGINGNQWDGIYKQAVKLKEEKGSDVDAILIFAGTNDYNSSLALGEFFDESMKKAYRNGSDMMLKYRTPIMNDTTFCGRINKAMSFLKNNFPQQQIILLTPIHRGYAKFNEKNVQPDENFSNKKGLFIDSYVDALKQASTNWAVPLIDLYSISGLYPLADAQIQYFHNAKTDKLHPNAAGDYRLAKTIQYQLLSLPSTFTTPAN
ncbi:MAG: GDSL-type esterase/lipase family protein [Paludibacter sp.]|nr:GDSL-type esterase/lipase family protein [Paludibacter sp.]